MNFLKSIVSMGSAASAANIFMVVYALLVARQVGPGMYGILAANYGLTGLTVFLVNWGIDTWLLRSYSHSDSPAQLSGQVIRLKAVLGVLWCVVLWTVMPVLFPDLYPRLLLAVVILNGLVDSQVNVLYVVLLAANRIKVSASIFTISRAARLLVVIGLILGGVDNLVIFAATRLVVDGIIYYVTWLFSKQLISFRRDARQNSVFRQALPYGWSELLNIVNFQADINLVSGLSRNDHLIGNYSIAISLLNMYNSIIQSIQNVILPTLTGLFVNKNRRLVQASGILFAGSAIAGGAVSLAILFLGAQIILMVLGEEYLLAAQYTVMLAPIFFLKPLTYCASTILMSIDLQQQRLIPQAIAAVLKVVLMILVFPEYGIAGIIWVYLFSEIVMLAGYLVQLTTWYRRHWQKWVLAG